jgi:ureidoacrylate peracid hydrolase
MTPDQIRWSRTALLVIDCQVDFGSPDGAMAQRGADMTAPLAAVAKAESLVNAARAAGVSIVFVRLITRDETRKDDEPILCAEGTRGADFIGPQPLAGETIISKTRYSAFARTGLAEQLHAQGIDTLVLAGLTTECCVASSAWDGFEHDFHIVLAADACAAYEESLHHHALKALELSGAKVVASAKLTAGWKKFL